MTQKKPAPSPYEIDFFLALRRLQSKSPERPRIGESLRPSEDIVQLHQPPDLRFAPSSISAWHEGENGKLPRIEVNFMGLFGPNGALPLHLTEYAEDRLREGDKTLVAFANIFHNRLISLFFRSWAAHQKTVDFDRPEGQRFKKYLGSLIGIGMPSLENRDDVHDTAKIYFSGRLSPQNRSAEGLAAILSEYYGVPADIESFSGRWLRLPERDTCQLGDSKATGLLGQTVIVGSRIWECQTKFRIRLGPMGFQDLLQILPATDSFNRLKTWVLNYIGKELEWDVQMVLKASEVPTMQLGKDAYVGWTTWLSSTPPAHDVDDVIFNPELD